MWKGEGYGGLGGRAELELTGTEMSGLEKGVRWDLDKERTGSVV